MTSFRKLPYLVIDNNYASELIICGDYILNIPVSNRFQILFYKIPRVRFLFSESDYLQFQFQI